MASSSRIRKTILIVFFALAVLGIVFFALIFHSWNRVYENRKSVVTPYDYPGSVWKSEDPEIVLEVSTESSSPEDSTCWLVCNGQEFDVIFFPGYPQRASFELRDAGSAEMEDIRLLVCEAKFSERKVTLKVIKDYMFNDEYKTITLDRVS